MKRLNIVVPYRAREAHLRSFAPALRAYFTRDKVDHSIPYQVLVIEQEGGLPFNRGALNNIGFVLGQENSDYTCFHDVDYLPIWADYSWSDTPCAIVWFGAERRPISLGNRNWSVTHALDEFFGGVVLTPNSSFEQAGGFANVYWGWGYEDVDLKKRFERVGIPFGRRKGTFQALDHDSAGFRTDGSLSSFARKNRQRFETRWNGEDRLDDDGLKTLAFKVLDRRPLPEGQIVERAATWEVVTVRLQVRASPYPGQPCAASAKFATRKWRVSISRSNAGAAPATSASVSPEHDECRKTIRNASSTPDGHQHELLKRAFAAYGAGELTEAESLAEAMVTHDPRLFGAWHLLSVIQAARGRADDALASSDHALKLDPENAQMLVVRGAILHALRRYGDALECYDRALSRQGDSVEALSNRAATLLELQRFAAALASCDCALALNPEHAETHCNRGDALRALARFGEAVASYNRALSISPRYAQAFANRGVTLLNLRRFADALADFDRALALVPTDARAHFNRGNALHDLGRYEEALASFDSALALKPDSVEARYNRANTLFELGRFKAALEAFEALDVCDEGHPFALDRAAQSALQLCDWERQSRYAPRLIDHVRDNLSAVAPLTLFGYADNPELHAQAARNFASRAVLSSRATLPAFRRRPEGKPRIAYLSADFQQHALAHLISELLERHDRSSFEIFGLSFGVNDDTAARKRFVAAFDRFHDVYCRSDREIAELLRKQSIDIAVDLNGHTRNSRFGVLAHRPALVQVNYLGFPGTMGSPFIDYILADRIVAPPEADQFYAEKIVRLPHCYQANDTKRAISGEPPPSRKSAGLPTEGFVFCCFSHNWKITETIFDIWMRILSQVEASVLWLLKSTDEAESNLRREAATRGVNPNRLVFASRTAPEEHLARHRLADLFLDTLPYNAHTTASDALWMGLPVLTCPGTAFPSRVSASLLTAVALPDLIARSLIEYEALAVRIARQPHTMRSLRDRLARSRATNPLFDVGRTTKAIEAAYRHMILTRQQGLAARGFNVVERSPRDHDIEPYHEHRGIPDISTPEDLS